MQKSIWTACDLAMSMSDSKHILIFSSFNKTKRTQEYFHFNIETNVIFRDSYLPKVGSFSNYVFNYDHNLNVVDTKIHFNFLNESLRYIDQQIVSFYIPYFHDFCLYYFVTVNKQNISLISMFNIFTFK